MVFKTQRQHRSNSSLGNQLDLVHRMVSRWGSMGGDEIDPDGLGHSDTDSEGDDNHSQARPSTADPSSGLDVGMAHRRKRSAQQEIFQKKAEQESLEQVFDQYIDPENNGECDTDEWMMGLRELGVNLNETQQRVLFKLMDIDNSGMVDKEEFVQTMMGVFEHEELNLLRQPVLDAVQEHRREQARGRSDSNLIGGPGGGLSQDWTDQDLEVLQQEMQAAMFAMVEPMQQKLSEEEKFHHKMEQRLAENPDIMEPSNAMNWTKYEVARWVQEMQMERYVRYFVEERVDGPMLIEDMTQDMLESNLAVRTIHARKIMREIYNLKLAVRGVTDKVLDISDFLCSHSIEDIDMKIAAAKVAKDLEIARRSKEKLKEFYEKELTKLGQQLIDLQESHKKGKRKKKNKRSDSKIVLPVPPKFEDADPTLIDMGVPSRSPLFGISEKSETEDGTQGMSESKGTEDPQPGPGVDGDIVPSNTTQIVTIARDSDTEHVDSTQSERSSIVQSVVVESKEEDRSSSVVQMAADADGDSASGSEEPDESESESEDEDV